MLTVPVDSSDPNQSLLRNLVIIPSYSEYPHGKPLLLVQENLQGNFISEVVGERVDPRKQFVELAVEGLLQYPTSFRFPRTWLMKEIYEVLLRSKYRTWIHGYINVLFNYVIVMRYNTSLKIK